MYVFLCCGQVASTFLLLPEEVTSAAGCYVFLPLRKRDKQVLQVGREEWSRVGAEQQRQHVACTNRQIDRMRSISLKQRIGISLSINCQCAFEDKRPHVGINNQYLYMHWNQYKPIKDFCQDCIFVRVEALPKDCTYILGSRDAWHFSANSTTPLIHSNPKPSFSAAISSIQLNLAKIVQCGDLLIMKSDLLVAAGCGQGHFFVHQQISEYNAYPSPDKFPIPRESTACQARPWFC